MAVNEFDIGGIIALKFRHEMFYTSKFETRELLRKSALSVLERAYKPGEESKEETFYSILSQKGYDLTDGQKCLVANICVAASSAYKDWREDADAEKQRVKELRKAYASSMSIPTQATESTSESAPASDTGLIIRRIHAANLSLHGGSGYTGRLTGGFAAPHGSESYHAADEPRLGGMAWVKAVTAGGNGAGYSLAEISGNKVPKFYEDVLPPDVFYRKRQEDLLRFMDKATTPGNFTRAMLVYYRSSLIMQIGNRGSVNSANMNNPENTRTMTQLDSVLRHLQRMDRDQVLTPERETQFLVLCSDLLSKAKVKKPRFHNSHIYHELRGDLNVTSREIKSLLDEACQKSGISKNDMQLRIIADKTAHLNDYSEAIPSKPAGPVPAKK